MTIQIDDAGWGDPIGGVIIGIYRVETSEYIAKEIEVINFQEQNFSQKTFLTRGLELVLEALECLQVPKEEPIEVCRGAVLDGVRDGLQSRGYEVIPKKIEGQLQELVEANFVSTLERLGLNDIPRVSGKERFFRQLEWVQEDHKQRERHVKTGWKNWEKRLRNWRPKWRQSQRQNFNPPVIIKLGGSIISDKSKRSTPRLDTIRLLAKEISAVKSHPVVVVHGGGSYGHFPAKEYEIHRGGRSRKKKIGVTETALEMTNLGHLIHSAFLEIEQPVIPIRSSSIIVTLEGRISHMDLQSMQEFLRQGFIPILAGDVAADTVKGFTIISGDQISMYLARLLDSQTVIFATDVDGLYTADPKVDPKARRIDLITPETLNHVFDQIAVGAAQNAADVTEGMRGKLTEIFKGLPKGCEVIITDIRRPGTLNRILSGKPVPATRLRHSKTSYTPLKQK